MKKSKLFFVLLTLSFQIVFYSCNVIDELNTKKIDIDSVSYDFNDIIVKKKSTSGDNVTNSFQFEKSISGDEFKGFETVKKYRSHIESIKIGYASIIVTSNDEQATIIKNLTLSAEDSRPDFLVKEYMLGTEYSKGLNDYFEKLVLKALSRDSLDVLISGDTDVRSDKSLNVKITMEDITVVVKIIN